jgi:hypothetical protein
MLYHNIKKTVLAIISSIFITSICYPNISMCRKEANEFHCPSEQSIYLDKKTNTLMARYTENNRHTLWQDSYSDTRNFNSKKLKFTDVKEKQCINDSCQIVCEYTELNPNNRIISLSSKHQHNSFYTPESRLWKSGICSNSRKKCQFYIITPHEYTLSI